MLGVRPTRLVERYLLFSAVAILVSGLVLTAVGVQEMEIYYAVYVIEFLVAVELVASSKRSFEKQLRPIVLALVLGFIYIVLQRVLQILG